jgi:hypothetical protein
MPRRSTYEDDLQRAVAQWLDLQGWRWCHVANERKTSARAGRKLKEKGVKAGAPDVLIFASWEGAEMYADTNVPRFHGFGVAIELKSPRIKPGTDPRYPLGVKKTYPRKEQREWLADLEALGWYTKVCRTLNEVIDACECISRRGR